MFPSLSSCTPSTSVTTTFTAKTNQELVINQPVKVLGPNTYNITANVTGFDVNTEVGGTSYTNPPIHLQVGRTYRFNVNSPGNSVHLTTIGGTSYTTGLRYTEYSRNRKQFLHPGYQAFTAGPYGSWAHIPSFTYSSSIAWNSWTVFATNAAGDVIAVLSPYTDFTGSNPTASSVSFTFTTLSIPGWIVYLRFRSGTFSLPNALSGENYVVRVNGITKTLNSDYFVRNNYLSFRTSQPAKSIVTIEDHGGMQGGFFFTPTASTPDTLYYRSRVTSTPLFGVIRVSSTGYEYPANTPINLQKGDTASVTVTSPSGFLSYQFYEYFLSGSPKTKNYFAVVNKNNYNPLVKVPDRIKRYYNYVNYSPSFSLYDTVTKSTIYKSVSGLGSAGGIGYIDFRLCHVLLDVVNSQVNIYTVSAGLVRTVVMPDFPIEYDKYRYTVGGQVRVDLVVLCADGILYLIKPDLTVETCQQFTPDTRSIAFLNSNLPINEDIPFLGSFSDSARRNLVASLFPVVTSFAIFGSTVSLVGANTLAKVNLATKAIFSLQNFNTLGGLLNISVFGIFGVIATSLLHRVYFISNSGSSTDITPLGPALVLGQHCTMPSPEARVAVPDAHNHRLIVYNGASRAQISYINLGDFVPAYARNFDGIVYVTAHDSNEVIKIEIINPNESTVTETFNSRITRFYMTEKTTLVSAVGDSMLAYHYLNNRTILDFAGTGIKKVIPPVFEYREGPNSSIGTSPKPVYMLGEDNVTPVPGPFIQWWVNGQIKGNVRDGELLGINYRASEAGAHRSVIILGETAIDYDTKTFVDSSYTHHYAAGVFGTNFMPLTGTNYVAPIDASGDYVLPFNINYFGTTYSSLYFLATGGLTSGILIFDPSFPISTAVPGFSTVTTNALLVEPRRIYIDYPIDNRDVTDVKWGNLSGGKIPGAYYTQGIVGEFQYYKWKYVGTEELPLPNGFVLRTENVAQTGVNINMLSTTGITVGDYVSNPIVGTPPYATIISTGPVVGDPIKTPKSLQVSNITSYSGSIVSYWTEDKKFYCTTAPAVPFKLYSKVTDISGSSYGYSNAISYSNFYTGNVVIAVESANNRIIVDGLTDTILIDKDKFIFEFTTQKTSTTYERGNVAPFFSNIVVPPVTTTTVSEIVRASSIQYDIPTFNPVFGRTDQYIEVTKAVYDQLTVGQNLYSDIFSGPEPLIGKEIRTKTFRMRIDPRLAYEGDSFTPSDTINIDLFATNVDDGTYIQLQVQPGNLLRQATIDLPNSDFMGGWIIESPIGTPRQTITNPTSTPISFQMYGNSARVKLRPLTDTVTGEGVESYKVRFLGVQKGNPTSQVSIPTPYDSSILSINPAISSTRSGTVGSPTVSFPEYFLKLSNSYTTTTSTVITTARTRFNFSSIPAAIKLGTVTSPITYALPQPAPPAPPVTNFADTQTVDIYTVTLFRQKTHIIELINNTTKSITGTLTTLLFSGKYLTFDYPQTLPADTPMLFKPFVTHNPVEFELALYVGRNFQYVEYNYLPPVEHNNSLVFGLRDLAGSYIRSVSGNPPTIYSHLFGGEASNGIFFNLGPGSFFHIPSGGFLPRYPRIYRERVFDETTVHYDIYIDFKIPPLIDLRASLDYGYLYLNNGYYDGSINLKENDVLSVYVPFQGSKIVSSVILSIGPAQFALPAANNTDIKSKVETLFELPNQPIITNINSSFVVPATGRYMVPDYFRSASGNGAEYEFEYWIGGTTFGFAMNRGEYYDLVAGDTIIVKNIFTGYRDYNAIEIVLAGVQIQKFKLETVGKPANIIDFINYGVLDKPFKRLRRSANVYLPINQDIVFDNTTGPKFNQFNPLLAAPTNFNTFDGHSVTEYEATPLTIQVSSLTPGLPVELFATGGNIAFIKNFVRTGSNTVSAVTGDSIGLEWELNNYHESNVRIYQITIDPIDSSNVFTYVGQWAVSNWEPEPLLVTNEQGAGRSVVRVDISSAGSGYDRNNISVVFDPPGLGGETAEGFALVSDLPAGQILQIIVTSGGSGYVVAPDVTIIGIGSGAVLSSVLVEDVIPRETELRIPFRPTLYSDRIPLVTSPTPSIEIFRPSKESVKLTANMRDQGTDVPVATFAFKPNVEYTYVTTPDPMQVKVVAQSFITKDYNFTFSRAATIATTSTQSKVLNFSEILGKAGSASMIKFDHITGSTSVAPKVTYNFFTGKQAASSSRINYVTGLNQNVSKVLQPPTEITPKLPNYSRNNPATQFFGRYNGYLSPGGELISKSIKGYGLLPITSFVDKYTPTFMKSGTLLNGIMPSPTVLKSAIGFGTVFIPYNKITIITQIEYAASNPVFSPQVEQIAKGLSPKPDSISVLKGNMLTSELVYINYLDNVTKISPEWFYISRLLSPTAEPDRNYFNTVTGQMPEPQRFMYEIFFTTLDPNVTQTNFFLGNLTENTTYITVLPLGPLEARYNLPEQGDVTMPEAETVKFTLINPVVLEGEYKKPTTVFPQTFSSEWLTFTRMLLPVTPYYETINYFNAETSYKTMAFNVFTEINSEEFYTPGYFETNIDPERVFINEFRPNIDPERVLISEFTLIIDPELQARTGFYNEIDEELVNETGFYRDMSPEFIFQDKLFTEISPELIYQDKLFTNISPNLYVDEKGLVDLVTELFNQDKAFINLMPELSDSGNRYSDFIPELVNSGNREVNFDAKILTGLDILLSLENNFVEALGISMPLMSEFTPPTDELVQFDTLLGDSGNKNIDFKPILADPGNRYLDFLPRLDDQKLIPVNLDPEIVSQDKHFQDFPPELLYQDKWFQDFPPELLYQDKWFQDFPPLLNVPEKGIVEMDWQLFQLDVQYLKDASVYGAFKTEFKIYADDGRAGDFGQYKGTPPGTPGRARGPYIPYQQFMGSALVMKTSTYNLGGFSSQADAQAFADKYVNAQVIKAYASDVWNIRIHFGKRVFYPRKSRIFPRIWYIRGG